MKIKRNIAGDMALSIFSSLYIFWFILLGEWKWFDVLLCLFCVIVLIFSMINMLFNRLLIVVRGGRIVCFHYWFFWKPFQVDLDSVLYTCNEKIKNIEDVMPVICICFKDRSVFLGKRIHHPYIVDQEKLYIYKYCVNRRGVVELLGGFRGKKGPRRKKVSEGKRCQDELSQ